MDRINQFAFYELAKTLQPLRRYAGDVVVIEALWELITAEQKMGLLLRGNPVPLGFSKASAEALHKAIEDVIRNNCVLKDSTGAPRWPDGSEPPIPEWRWLSIIRALDTFETVFSEEMREAATYFVPRRGIFHTPALVDGADESFPADVRGNIPAKTIEDWKAAGRCLAFNLLSASGFHVARAVEGTLEAYYQLFSGKPGKTLKSWGDYLAELEKIKASGVNPTPQDRTLAEVRQMKDDYRNPLMHPRVVLTESDARMLFNNGESLIIAMAQEIGNAASGTQLALIPAAQTASSPPPVVPQKKGKQAGP